MHSRLSVNPICTASHTFAEDLALYRRLGVERAGLLSRKLADHGWDRALDDVRAAGIDVPYLVHGIFTPVDRADEWRREELDLLIGAARTAAALGAGFVYLCTGPAGALTWEEAAEEFGERMAPVLDAAGDLGVRISIENTHTSRPELGFAFGLADAVALARPLGMGVCVDLYCCWLERGLDDLLNANTDLIDLVQVSDFVIGGLVQPDRLVAGDGDLPMRRAVERVLAAGYDGCVDLELLGPAVEAEGYESSVGRGMAALDRMLRELDPATGGGPGRNN